MSSIQCVILFALSATLPAACAPAVVPEQTVAPLACSDGEVRCDGQQHQVCEQGTFQTLITCAPSEQCSVDQLCVGSSSCGSGADLIYAVDTEGQLLSFNPRRDFNHFHVIGALQCPAGPAQSTIGTGQGKPFSMAVDRSAHAWVSYSSGEIFSVDTTTAACEPTRFRAGGNFSLFGMGFVADRAGEASESLYISGNASTTTATATLGVIDTTTMTARSLGPLQQWSMSPELSGTGAAELFAYFPGSDRSQVVQLDKLTQSYKHAWPLPGLAGDVRGWAFAHWGGRFYIFVSTKRQGQLVNEIIRFDPTDGSRTVVVGNSPYLIVGAGVSTCAPYIIG